MAGATARETGMTRRSLVRAAALAAAGWWGVASAFADEAADIVLVNGRVITMDAEDRVVEALAIREGRITAAGDSAGIRNLIGNDTRVVDLDGRSAVPGFIESHTHALGVARSELTQPWVELNSVAEIQDWVRRRATELPEGRWIAVPRVDITRLAERRHPTPAELDAACTTHPVYVNAARKTVLNSLGFETVGVTRDNLEIPGGKVIVNENGDPWLISGDSHVRAMLPRPELSDDEVTAALRKVHAVYNSVGITSIFERAGRRADWDLYGELKSAGQLTVRTRMAIRQQFRSGEEVAPFTEKLGLVTGDGDDWLRVGPLKITVDGGIHWGNTRLSEPYGERRIAFYTLDDPDYRGDQRYSVDLMRDIFSEATKRGWQCSCHVTGDAGVAAVLEAVAAADAIAPLRDRRFNLIHAYFPSHAWLDQAAELGVGVDTQEYLYYRDSDALARVYGESWAARFIGLADWMDHGVPVAINADHMNGIDPDHAMNSFNPLLMLWIAVTRKNDQGDVYGPQQKLSRLDALRCVTTNAAWLSFDEDRLGSLAPGKLADVAVLDRDYLDCAEDEIRDIEIDLTIVDGNVVYERQPRD